MLSSRLGGSLLDRLKQGIQKTRAGLVEAIEDTLHGKKQIDADLLEELEYRLIGADIGVRTTNEILERIRQRVDRKAVNDASQLRGLIREHLLEVLQGAERPVHWAATPPTVKSPAWIEAVLMLVEKFTVIVVGATFTELPLAGTMLVTVGGGAVPVAPNTRMTYSPAEKAAPPTAIT